MFEADPNLTYRFAWQRQNAYQQNVYGIVTAHGKITPNVFFILKSEVLNTIEY